MRILLVAESFTPRRNTGIAVAVVSLARQLQKHHEVVLASSVSHGDEEGTHAFLNGLSHRLFRQSLGLPRTVSPALGYYFEQEVGSFDLVHTHGLWRFPQWAATQAAHRYKVPYIVSPHGMCEPFELRNKAWKKKLFFQLFERRILEQAAAIHAITDAERNHCEQLHNGNNIRVIPNGVEIASPVTSHSLQEFLPETSSITPQHQLILYLGRLHPKKGLNLLLPAFAKVLERHPKSRLVLAGPDPIGYKATLVEMSDALRLRDKVLFPGMVSGPTKLALLQRADLFVLPSYSEGFSMSVLEALAAARPVVITHQCYFDRVEEERCGRVVATSPLQIAQAINDLLDLEPTIRAEMGLRGRSLVERFFTWPVIAQQMSDLYQTTARKQPVSVFS